MGIPTTRVRRRARRPPRRYLAAVPTCALACALGASSHAARLAIGPEFQVNSTTVGDQASPAVAAQNSGFVVVWESRRQSDAPAAVFARLYDAWGSPVAKEFRVHAPTRSAQDEAAVASDGAGNFVVVWASSGNAADAGEVVARRFSLDASPLGSAFRVNAYTTDIQDNPKVAMDPGGNFVVVWESAWQDGDGIGVFGRRFTAAGKPASEEFRVNTETRDGQLRPSVGIADSGAFVVVWHSIGQDGDAAGIFGQRFAADGRPLGSEFRVNQYTALSQDEATVAVRGDGAFFVVWESFDQDGDANGVFGRFYDTNGAPVGDELRVNETTARSQDDASVAAGEDGWFVAMWESIGQDASDAGVYVRRFDAAGRALGPERRVNDFITRAQDDAAVAVGKDARLFAVWQSDRQDGSLGGIYARVIRVDDARALPGDCNADGVVDLSDTVLIVRRLIGSRPRTASGAEAADCNCDDSVDSADALCTVLRSLGALADDPCGS